MPPPFKPGRTDEDQTQRANTDENQASDVSIKIQTSDSNTRLSSPKARVPPALQPLKAVASTLKNAGSTGASHPGPRSVFFTTAKIVGSASVPGQITRLSSPTTTQAGFLLPQTRINENKQNISSTPPTLMFRPATHQIKPSPLTIQNQPPNSLPPILQSQRPAGAVSSYGSSTQATSIITQAQKLASSVSSLNNSGSGLQTVSVIKQQAVSSQNNSSPSHNSPKSFTSITDILSNKDNNKSDSNNAGRKASFLSLRLFVC